MKIFIPIKEKSQRVPRKNFRLLGGVPLYRHTLLKLTEHEVYLDTDSDELIEEIKKDNKLKNVVPFKRKEYLCGHKVSVCDLIKDFVVENCIKQPIVQLHVTSPFLTEEVLLDAYRHMENHDSVVSCKVHKSRFWRKEEYGFCPVNHNPLKMEQTQDLPTLFEENSAFYIFKPDVILSTGNRIGRDPYFYPIMSPLNIDIDFEEDWLEVLREFNNQNVT